MWNSAAIIRQADKLFCWNPIEVSICWWACTWNIPSTSFFFRSTFFQPKIIRNYRTMKVLLMSKSEQFDTFCNNWRTRPMPIWICKNAKMLQIESKCGIFVNCHTYFGSRRNFHYEYLWMNVCGPEWPFSTTKKQKQAIHFYLNPNFGTIDWKNCFEILWNWSIVVGL